MIKMDIITYKYQKIYLPTYKMHTSYYKIDYDTNKFVWIKHVSSTNKELFTKISLKYRKYFKYSGFRTDATQNYLLCNTYCGEQNFM